MLKYIQTGKKGAGTAGQVDRLDQDDSPARGFNRITNKLVREVIVDMTQKGNDFLSRRFS